MICNPISPTMPLTQQHDAFDFTVLFVPFVMFGGIVVGGVVYSLFCWGVAVRWCLDYGCGDRGGAINPRIFHDIVTSSHTAAAAAYVIAQATNLDNFTGCHQKD